jgi:hypothetical protein
MSIFAKLIEPVTGILDKVIPDKDLKNKLAHEISTMAESHMHEEMRMQMEVNKQEAAHKSLFVAGWRPFVGAVNFLVVPLANPFLPQPISPLELEVMMPVLMGMLGLGAMRSYEKKNGVSREK